MPDEVIAQNMVEYIRAARIKFPTYAAAEGTIWEQAYIDPAEAHLLAYAALDALDQLGFEIVPKPKSAASGEADRL
jgi:hypothetical protein